MPTKLFENLSVGDTFQTPMDNRVRVTREPVRIGFSQVQFNVVFETDPDKIECILIRDAALRVHVIEP